MEWYTLDSDLKRAEVIEGFESMIWSERYNVMGDFELVALATTENKRFYTKGTRLTKAGSTYVATIQTVEEKMDNDVRVLDVTGKFLEQLLDDRAGIPGPGLRTLTDAPQWDITDVPKNIMTRLFTAVCVTGDQSALDTIPFYHSGTLLPAGSIPFPSDTVHMTLELGSLYSLLNTVAVAYNLGFRLVRNGEASEIYFEVYTGNDRTLTQVDRDPLVFSPELDNLSNIAKLTSNAAVKTVAYVLAPNGTAEVYSPTVNAGDSGSERRVLFVKADDIDLAAGPDLTTALQARGLAELAKYNEVYAFAGDADTTQLMYGTDYGLGDLCTEIDETGQGTKMMVTEQIFVSDKTGEKSYPTLSVVEEIVSGTWSGLVGTWADQTDTWATLS